MTPPSEEIITKNEEYEELGRKEVKEAVTSLSVEAFMFLDVLCFRTSQSLKSALFVFFNPDNIPGNVFLFPFYRWVN